MANILPKRRLKRVASAKAKPFKGPDKGLFEFVKGWGKKNWHWKVAEHAREPPKLVLEGRKGTAREGERITLKLLGGPRKITGSREISGAKSMHAELANGERAAIVSHLMGGDTFVGRRVSHTSASGGSWGKGEEPSIKVTASTRKTTHATGDAPSERHHASMHPENPRRLTMSYSLEGKTTLVDLETDKPISISSIKPHELYRAIQESKTGFVTLKTENGMVRAKVLPQRKKTKG